MIVDLALIVFQYLSVPHLLTLRKVNKYYHRWVIKFLTQNYTSFEIIVHYLVNLHGLKFIRHLGSNPHLTLSLIHQYKDYLCWEGISANRSVNREWLEHYILRMSSYILSKNKSLDTDMIERFYFFLIPSFLSHNPALTEEIINKHPELKLSYPSYSSTEITYNISMPKGLTLSEIFSRPGGTCDWRSLSRYASLSWMDVLDHPELPWVHRELLNNHNWQ